MTTETKPSASVIYLPDASVLDGQYCTEDPDDSIARVTGTGHVYQIPKPIFHKFPVPPTDVKSTLGIRVTSLSPYDSIGKEDLDIDAHLEHAETRALLYDYDIKVKKFGPYTILLLNDTKDPGSNYHLYSRGSFTETKYGRFVDMVSSCSEPDSLQHFFASQFYGSATPNTFLIVQSAKHPGVYFNRDSSPFNLEFYLAYAKRLDHPSQSRPASPQEIKVDATAAATATVSAADFKRLRDARVKALEAASQKV